MLFSQLHTFALNRTAKVLSRGQCYLKEFSLHYYPWYKRVGFTPASMVDEGLMREAIKNVLPQVKKAREFNQVVRLSEANSMTGR